jgi:hypothetical protein
MRWPADWYALQLLLSFPALMHGERGLLHLSTVVSTFDLACGSHHHSGQPHHVVNGCPRDRNPSGSSKPHGKEAGPLP